MKRNVDSIKYLIFLTSGFPYGNGETFIENEIPFLARAFEKIFIVLPDVAKCQTLRPVPENVTKIPYQADFNLVFRIKAWFCKPFWHGLFLDIKRTKRQTGFVNIFRTGWHYFTHALQVKKAIQKVMVQNRLKPGETMLYSYWMDDKALGAALVKKKIPEVKALTRAHRWDIYEEMHPIPFLPFRPWLGKNLDLLIFISKQGQNYFKEKYPEVSPIKLVLSYLGTLPLKEKKTKKIGEKFSIISCSGLIPRKRVDLIAHALIELEKPVNWTHFGNGPEMGKIKWLVQEVEKKGGRVILSGNLPNKDVRKYYEENQIDLFITTSESEGLPVSMMEAQSAGIPILATNVGGINEIVIDGKTGWLLSKNPKPREIKNRIEQIFEVKDAEMNIIKENCLKHWQLNFDARKNYLRFIELF